MVTFNALEVKYNFKQIDRTNDFIFHIRFIHTKMISSELWFFLQVIIIIRV